MKETLFLFLLSIVLLSCQSHPKDVYTLSDLEGEWKQTKIEILKFESNNPEQVESIKNLYTEMTNNRKDNVLELFTFSPGGKCVFTHRLSKNDSMKVEWEKTVKIDSTALLIEGILPEGRTSSMTIDGNKIYWDIDITNSVQADFSQLIVRSTFEKMDVK